MEIRLSTGKRVELRDMTRQVAEACGTWGKTGLVHLYCPQTTAGIMVSESYDPDVAGDILAWIAKEVSERAAYAHAEGNSDAHIRSALTGCEVSLPVHSGELALRRWQGVFFAEFDGPRQRTLTLTFLEGSE